MIDTKKHKSSRTQLEERGFIDFLTLPQEKSLSQLLIDLQSPKAITRSIAARLLKDHIQKNEVIDALLHALSLEKALYTKIEITHTLQNGDLTCIKQMIPYLGKIGHNQYVVLPSKVSKKASYPLARDIIARTLANMDIQYLPYFINILSSCPLQQARELIDAIGYLLFYHPYDQQRIYPFLVSYFDNCEDDILKWKICMSFSALKPISVPILESLSKQNNLIGLEAQRALKIKK